MKKRFFIAAMLLLAAGSVFAQEGGADTQTVNLLEMVKTGGWAMWPLGAFSFFMVVLVIQNFNGFRY